MSVSGRGVPEQRQACFPEAGEGAGGRGWDTEGAGLRDLQGTVGKGASSSSGPMLTHSLGAEMVREQVGAPSY